MESGLLRGFAFHFHRRPRRWRLFFGGTSLSLYSFVCCCRRTRCVRRRQRRAATQLVAINMNSQHHQPCSSTFVPLDGRRQLQQQRYEGGPIDVSVGMLVFLLLVCCTLLCVPLRQQRSSQRQHQHQHHNSRNTTTSRPEELTMQQAQTIAAEAEVLRNALQQMLGVAGFDGSTFNMTDEPWLNDRRDYIRNVLITKRVHLSAGKSFIDITDKNDEKDAVDSAATVSCEQPSLLIRQQSRTHIILNTALNQDGDVADNNGEDEETTTATCSLETCPICLCRYEENDEISWSHNNECRHLFHRQCIEKWLLNHEDCPCCRSLFLVFVNNNDESIIHNSNQNGGDPSDASHPRNARQQQPYSSSSPISTLDSSTMNRQHDELMNDESHYHLARGMNLFYRYGGAAASSRGHAQSSSSTNLTPTVHDVSTINRTSISASNHIVEEMAIPQSPNNSTTLHSTSAALQEDLEEFPPLTVRHHDEPTSSSSMIEIPTATTTM